MAQAPREGKVPMVTIDLTITYPAKANMTVDDFLAEANKAKEIVAKAKELKPGATVEGAMKIGGQKLEITSAPKAAQAS
jgi:hypothetical protein